MGNKFLSIDEAAVRTIQINNTVLLALLENLGVKPGNFRVIENELIFPGATNPGEWKAQGKRARWSF
jgi:hypothetical protein